MKRKYSCEIRLQQSISPEGVATSSPTATKQLPEPVRRFMRFSGAIHGPVPRRMEVKLRGRIRSNPYSPWMRLRSEQVDRFDPDGRLVNFISNDRYESADGWKIR